MTRRSRALLAMTAATAIIAPLAGSAVALPRVLQCSLEENFFVERTPNSTSIYGSANTVFVENRTVDTCQGPSGSYGRTGATAHFSSPDDTRFVEIGWEESLDSNGTKQWKVFVESCDVSNPNNIYCYLPKSFVANLSHGYNDIFRVYSQPIGSTTFEMCVDFRADGNCVPEAGVTPGFSNGRAEGETFRVGGGSGAVDHHWTLQALKSDGTWIGWYAQQLDPDVVEGIGGFQYCFDFVNEYHVAQSGPGC